MSRTSVYLSAAIALTLAALPCVAQESGTIQPLKDDEFRCRDGRVIPNMKVCDGNADCVDGSDENNFTICRLSRPCEPHEFTCSNRRCISLVQICNNRDDCGDQSDELGCNGTGQCETAGCQQRCISLSTGGFTCHCSPGFHLVSDKQQCDDINECAHMKMNYCPQQCHNTAGSYNCTCSKGYVASEYKCLATGEPEVLIYANGAALLALQQGVFRYFIATDANITSMDIDPKEGIIYWINSNNFLKRSYIPGTSKMAPPSGFEQVLARVNTKVTSISTDWIARNLYWTELVLLSDGARGIISVSTIDGRFKLPLIISELQLPASIVTNPEMGYMYWTDIGDQSKIEMSWLDGSNRKVLFNKDLKAPMGLAIDYHMRHRIYWADTILNRLESANWDGTDRVVIAEGEHLNMPARLDVFGLTLYWTPRNSSEVRRIDKFGRGVQVTVSKHAQPITDFKVFQTVKYNVPPNPCVSLGCSHLCLLTPKGPRCACPEGATFQPNSNNICAAVIENPRPDPYKCLCLNGGLCRVTPKEVTCQCTAGYRGPRCETFVNPNLSG